jgi:hypothetical protein
LKDFLKHVRLAVRSAVQYVAKPYEVRVAWDLDAFTHRAANLKEANNWASLYPPAADVWITTRSGRVVSFRHRARVFGWTVA